MVAALYGLITLLFLLLTQILFPILFRTFYNDQEWTVGREIAQTMANVLLITIGNFLLSCYLEFFSWSFETLMLFIGFTWAVGIIPVTIQALVRQNIYHRRNAKAGTDDNQIIAERPLYSLPSVALRISREDGEKAFQTKTANVLAIESSGNYIEVHQKEGKPALIRKSLNSTEELLPESFFRTHRSWIVNLNLINHVDGNARGYTLSFENSELLVPVSRGKLKEFDAALQANSRE